MTVEEMSETAATISMVIAIVLLLASIFESVKSRATGTPMWIGPLLGTTFFFGGSMFFKYVLPLHLGEEAEPKPSKKPVADSKPTFTMGETPTDSGADFEIVKMVLTGVGVMVILAVVYFLGRFFYDWAEDWLEDRQADKRIARDQARREATVQQVKREERQRLWTGHLETYHDLCSRYNAYQTDLSMVTKYPMMVDLTEPLTKAMTQDYLDMVAKYTERPPNVEPLDQAGFLVAVRRFTVSFTAAESQAKKTGLRKFDPAERKKIRRAQDLLALALDQSGNEAERQSAYRQAIKMLEGLIVVPDKAIAALETSHRLLLTSSNDR